MTVNEILVQTLSPFGKKVTTDFDGGNEEEYITFNPASDRAEGFADDTPFAVVTAMQIHWFLPSSKNYLSEKKAIRNALFEAGFSYPEVTVIPESKERRHIIFECEIENDFELE